MQFQNPQILYALFLLLIPIFIHLFQLRRFKKQEFTNVAFLKRVVIQTRKSSRLKKWLILATRLLAFAMLILAFAQPFYGPDAGTTSDQPLLIYLDNSYSMQANGAAGPLKERAVQDLIEHLDEEQEFTLITNEERFSNLTIAQDANTLLELPYSPNQLNSAQINLQINQWMQNVEGGNPLILLISDFQQRDLSALDLPEQARHWLVPLQAQNPENVAIDSLYLQPDKEGTQRLVVALSRSGSRARALPVSLFNVQDLIAKATAEFNDGILQTELNFQVQDNQNIDGMITLDDGQMRFDNIRYFQIKTPSRLKVLVIGEASDAYLQRIFIKEEFEYRSSPLEQLDYSLIEQQHTVVLNELQRIPTPLAEALSDHLDEGGSIAIIPAETIERDSYEALLNRHSPIKLGAHQYRSKKITTIVFEHPLYRSVFDRRVRNFQYPSTALNYEISGGNPALRYEDNQAFLTASGKLFFFASPLNDSLTNFQSTPLIVPTFYNIARLSFNTPPLYFELGKDQSFDVEVSLSNDEILELTLDDSRFIPQQELKAQLVTVSTREYPKKPGSYSIVAQDTVITKVSYNIPRSESQLNPINLSDFTQYETATQLDDLLLELKASTQVQSLWKWFVIFALLALCAEVLLLKFIP
ncbi:BatA domain-containing protein [Croceiramulus getboli]|nr:BatA domain-containing protein [Flavobacteriaceae bacterium YJPT1-3]